MSHRRVIQSFNSLLSNAFSDGASYPAKLTATDNAGDLCPACVRVSVEEFLTPYVCERNELASSRPKRQFTDETYLISEIAERSGTCALCRLIAYAVHARLAIEAGKPLPEPSESTPADAIKAFFPNEHFAAADDFSQCRALLCRGQNSYQSPVPPSKSWFKQKRKTRVVYRIEVHLVHNSFTEAQLQSTVTPSDSAVGFIQLLMDKAEDQKMIPDFSMKSFQLGRTVPEKVRYPQIQNWLKICQGRHPDCASNDKGKYPERMRVIDVNNWQICDAPENAPFVTLSYCWGKDQQYKLLDKYLDIWTKPNGLVAKEELPRTIQDAVALVKALGWYYLWVDALCIVQNSDKVKMDQIEQMDRIYAHSRFTIVAADGKDCDAGLPGVTSPRRKMQLIATVQGHLAVMLPNLSDSLKTSVWNTRGWTYQELLLSSATLFFTPHQLYFECFAREVISEDFYVDRTESLPDLEGPFVYSCVSYKPSLRAVISDHMRRSRDVLTEHENSETYLYSVSTVLQEYTSRSLTEPNDIFNAVLGAYNRLHNFSPIWGRGVIAGLPIVAFDQALTWLPLSAPCRRTTSDKTFVPQWTWASHTGPVQVFWRNRCTYPPLISDIHIHTTTGLRIHIPTPLIDSVVRRPFRHTCGPAETYGINGWSDRLRRALPDPDPATIEKAKLDIIMHKGSLMARTEKLEFRSEVATLWIAPRPARREGMATWYGVFNNTGEGHEVAPIVTAEGVWAGTLRLPGEMLDKIVEDGEPKRVEFVAVLRATTRDRSHADETAWLESKDMARPVPANPEEGEIVVVLAVERSEEGLARWAVGTVVKAAWMQAGAKEEVVFMI